MTSQKPIPVLGHFLKIEKCLKNVDLQDFRYSAVIRLYICICILFQILFHYGLLQDFEYSFLSHTVEPYWLSILYIVVCIC